MFVNCKVNSRHRAISFSFYLTGHVFKILTENYFRIQFKENVSARINYLLIYRQTANQGSDTDITKVKRSAVLMWKSSKEWECQKNVASTTTITRMWIPWPLVVPKEVKTEEEDLAWVRVAFKEWSSIAASLLHTCRGLTWPADGYLICLLLRFFSFFVGRTNLLD